jgi:hypothetical protein
MSDEWIEIYDGVFFITISTLLFGCIGLSIKYLLKSKCDNVNVCLNGGFSGYLSELTYFNSAISIVEIQSIISNGPNTKPVNNNMNETKPRYLADVWYFNQVK